MNLRKATPIFVVDAITPATVAFWEATGWKRQVEVPHEGDLGFLLLENDGQAVMFQTRASVKADLSLQGMDPSRALYLDVASLDEARAECLRSGARILIEERTTFYGAREMWVLDPAGVLIGYAQQGDSAA